MKKNAALDSYLTYLVNKSIDNKNKSTFVLYEKISFDLNISNIGNKIINLGQLYNYEEYHILLVKDNGKYYLIDANKNIYIKELDDYIFSNYLFKLNIYDNKFLLDEIYDMKALIR